MRKLFVFLLAIFLSLAGLACQKPQVEGLDGVSASVLTNAEDQPQLMDKIWLSPGKVKINDFPLGARSEWTLRIHNGNDYAAEFIIYYRYPDQIEDHFVVAPENALDWLSITDKSVKISPRETKDIKVALELPYNAHTPKQWEFWIGVSEKKQALITAELCSRCLITMKGN